MGFRTYVVIRCLIGSICLGTDDVANCVPKLVSSTKRKLLSRTANSSSHKGNDEEDAYRNYHKS